MKLKLLGDIFICAGLAVIGHGIYRLSPVASEFYIGAIALVAGVLVMRK